MRVGGRGKGLIFPSTFFPPRSPSVLRCPLQCCCLARLPVLPLPPSPCSSPLLSPRSSPTGSSPRAVELPSGPLSLSRPPPPVAPSPNPPSRGSPRSSEDSGTSRKGQKRMGGPRWLALARRGRSSSRPHGSCPSAAWGTPSTRAGARPRAPCPCRGRGRPL